MFCHPRHNLNQFGRGLLDNLNALDKEVSDEKIFCFPYIKAYVKRVIRRTGPVLVPGAYIYRTCLVMGYLTLKTSEKSRIKGENPIHGNHN